MQVAFYKGRKRLFNRLTSWWTRGPYSHCELVMPDGSFVSSSFMDNGVRIKRISINPDHWDFLEVDDATPEMWEAAINMVGTPYDTLGLVGFLFSPVADDRNKMFCSEFVKWFFGFSEPWRFNPNTTYSVIKYLSDQQAAKRNESIA